MAQPTTWQSLLAAQLVKPHKTSAQELSQLLAVVARDLKDAEIPQLSADRRFATAYNAVLQLATMAIACEGYRVSGAGHHHTTFRALDLALRGEAATLTTYFEKCRKKRNRVDYDMADVTTESEADDLLQKAKEFEQFIRAWIHKEHPQYRI